jgi:hypothetical protein
VRLPHTLHLSHSGPGHLSKLCAAELYLFQPGLAAIDCLANNTVSAQSEWKAKVEKSGTMLRVDSIWRSIGRENPVAVVEFDEGVT